LTAGTVGRIGQLARVLATATADLLARLVRHLCAGRSLAKRQLTSRVRAASTGAAAPAWAGREVQA
jgi:hypothetical protein